MSAVVLPHRLWVKMPVVSASPPPLSSLSDEENEKKVLCHPLLIAGPAVTRTSLSRVCDFAYWSSKQKVPTRPLTHRKAMQQREQPPPPPPQAPAVSRPQRSQQNGGKKDKLSAAYQRPQPVNRSAVMRARAVIGEFACPIDSEWKHIQDVSLQFLNGTSLNPKEVKIADIKFVGKAMEYNTKYDTLIPRNAVELVDDASNKFSYKIPSARGDSILADLITEDPELQVIVTDQVLAALMAAPLSRFGWQITAYKFNDKIILDKTNVDDSNLDLLTINETVPMEQMSETKQRDLAEECAKQQIELQSFILQKQSIAVHGEKADGDDPYAVDFDEEFRVPDCRLYRYRYLTLPPGHPIPGHQEDHCRKQPIKVALRSEIHAVQTSDDKIDYVKIHCLNEGLVKPMAGEIGWSVGLDKQKGSLLLNELRKNACKITKWIYSAILSGSSYVKLGFLSKKNNQVKILTIQSCRVADLAVQIGLKLDNGWGVIREILDIILSDTERSEGRYTITRDAITDTVRFHYAPLEEEVNETEEDEEITNSASK